MFQLDGTEHEPFIQAIVADPGNDVPRLIYADWLDDRHECSRAELIRVQCTLARMGPKPSHALCQGDPRCLACLWEKKGGIQLQDRAEELILMHDNTPSGGCWWHYPLPHGEDIAEWEWHRGFVEGFNVNWHCWVEVQKRLRKWLPIKQVYLRSWPQKPDNTSYNLSPNKLRLALGTIYPGIEFDFPTMPMPGAPVILTDHGSWRVCKGDEEPTAIIDYLSDFRPSNAMEGESPTAQVTFIRNGNGN